MAYESDVKWFHNNLQGAPTISGTAGHLLQVLDACLINGFNVQAVQSLVVANGIATATFASVGHGFVAKQIVRVDGASPTALNDDWRVLTVGATSLTFACPGLADGAASGTISLRAAPLGWVKTHSGTNKAIYRAPEGCRQYLRLDDTGTTQARARGFEAITDIDTGTGPFPTEAQLSGGMYVAKSNVASSAPRAWVLVGDRKRFALFVEYNASAPGTGLPLIFGDCVSHKAGDAYAGMLIAATGAPPANGFYDLAAGTDCGYLARSYTQIGGSQIVRLSGHSLSNRWGYSSTFNYPSPVSNGLLLAAPPAVREGAGPVRGLLPGLWQPIQNLPLTQGDFVDAAADGRDVLIAFGISSSGTLPGRIAIDITGPWS